MRAKVPRRREWENERKKIKRKERKRKRNGAGLRYLLFPETLLINYIISFLIVKSLNICFFI